ncbi:DUF1800 family protein [Geothrix sp. PMB-07]|uniref:DUF1800 family protein n=1 Tax=Geothrix sp. PMB-07 TaxID=3068640 RepID=UPI002741909B|nr:DUF1800 family protein [Geothrix sp. PMB-07]WLT32812.1 DUF1800 family protein [Geothrix sp. PMB-07]
MAGLFDVAKSSWTLDDVLHFSRRAGFHLKPEDAQVLVAAGPSATVDAWLDATASETAYTTARDTQGDVYYESATEGTNQGPHGFTLTPRGWMKEAQGHFCFSMQFNPNQAKERLALFWHQLFATGATKVDNVALMANQIQLFRDQGRGPFADLLKAVSHDPAMLRWLDGIANNVDGTGKAPNENYAREVMELFSLGPYNGYGEADIKAFAQLFAGWTFYSSGSELVADAGYPWVVSNGHAIVATGQTNPIGAPMVLDGSGSTLAANEKLPNRRNFPASATVTLFGTTVPVMGADLGENALALITTTRATECAQFLAKRILRHFLAPETDLSTTVFNDFVATLKAEKFHIGNALKKLFKSDTFYQAPYRFALVEGPVAWMIRQARALCPDLGKALVTPLKGTPGVPSFPVYAGGQYNDLEQMAWHLEYAGQKLLDPKGPNGWGEHLSWINSNTARYRSRLAAALAYGPNDFTRDGRDHPQLSDVGFFPSDPVVWFPTKPATPVDVWNRLVDLIQPAPIPTALRDQTLTGPSGLWGAGQAFAGWNATDQSKARDLAFILLSTPYAQVH